MDFTRGDDFAISTDSERLDIDVIHAFLVRSYWASQIPREIVERSIAHSLCFGVYHLIAEGEVEQVGFARVISDYATFAYLADVFILENFRGSGLSKWLIECVRSHPDLQGLRRWLLATKDAHALYKQFGFHELAAPERWLEIARPSGYSLTV